MSVYIGAVETFKAIKLDKAQALKPLEEAAEVFGAFQYLYDLTKSRLGAGIYEDVSDEDIEQAKTDLIDECCDNITATCNVLAALGIKDLQSAMMRCETRNKARGRM